MTNKRQFGVNQIINIFGNDKKDIIRKLRNSDYENIDLVIFKNILSNDNNFSITAKEIVEKAIFNNSMLDKKLLKLIFQFNKNIISEIIINLLDTDLGFFNINEIMSGISDLTESNDVIKAIIDNYIKNDFKFKDIKLFENIYQKNIFIGKITGSYSLRDFLFIITAPLFSLNENVRLHAFSTYQSNLKEYREKIFSYSKNYITALVDKIINSGKNDEENMLDEIKSVLDWDIWYYCETKNELKIDLFKFIDMKKEIIKNNGSIDISFYQSLNQVSMRTFKNMDNKFNALTETISSLSESFINKNKTPLDCENDFNKLNILLDKQVIRMIMKNIYEYYNSTGKLTEDYRNKVLHILIDDDIKSENKLTQVNKDPIFIEPLHDTENIYSEVIKKEILNKIDIELTSKKPVIEKLNKNNDEEILKIAVDIIKEVGKNFDVFEIKSEKEKIIEIVKEILSDRKHNIKTNNIKVIINKAINEAIEEVYFELL